MSHPGTQQSALADPSYDGSAMQHDACGAHQCRPQLGQLRDDGDGNTSQCGLALALLVKLDKAARQQPAVGCAGFPTKYNASGALPRLKVPHTCRLRSTSSAGGSTRRLCMHELCRIAAYEMPPEICIQSTGQVPAAMKRSRREEEATVWLPRDRAPINYVPKHKKRDTALEVVFDPKAHKCAGRAGGGQPPGGVYSMMRFRAL